MSEKVSASVLAQRQSLPLEVKVYMSMGRIEEWYHAHSGDVYVSFSGGKDSTVLLHLVRSLFPDVPAVFCDTGLEYPAVRDFVKTIPNVEWIKPKMLFKDVLEKYGYPVVSKEQSKRIYEYRTTKSEKHKAYLITGNAAGIGKISKKWFFLTEATFKISDRCCHYMKKRPFYTYEKRTKRAPIIGTMASDSRLRYQDYLAKGCNAFNSNRPISRPIGFWLEKDVWEYLKTNNVPYSSIYDTGVTRTGCMFCLYGLHMDSADRFALMEKDYPSQYRYCMETLKLREVIDYINLVGKA